MIFSTRISSHQPRLYARRAFAYFSSSKLADRNGLRHTLIARSAQPIRIVPPTLGGIKPEDFVQRAHSKFGVIAVDQHADFDLGR